MLKIKFTKRFKRDYKKCIKRGYDARLLETAVELIQRQEPLPPEYCDHSLQSSREYKDARECHLMPDWLLVYQVRAEELVLRLMRTGSHSELF